MKCLVVITHPIKSSLCYSLSEHVLAQLNKEGHHVEVEYLYESGFNPSLTELERSTYYEKKYDNSGVEKHIRRLISAEGIVLIYPTWWFGFPAVLKGWFDRVWSPGFAYDHASDYGPIRPKLNTLSKVLVITTLGAPWWIDRIVMRHPLKRILKYAIVGTCASNVKITYLSLYRSEDIGKVKFNRFIRKIEQALRLWS